MGLGKLNSVQLQLSWCLDDRNFHVSGREIPRLFQLKVNYKVLISGNILRSLVLLPNCLLGVLRSIEVKFVQIFNTWEQIFQGVSSRLYQGFGLGTEHKFQLHKVFDDSVKHVLNIVTQYLNQNL